MDNHVLPIFHFKNQNLQNVYNLLYEESWKAFEKSWLIYNIYNILNIKPEIL